MPPEKLKNSPLDDSRDLLSPEQRQRKRRLEGGAIALLTIGMLILTLIQREFIDLGPGFADSRGLVALVSINMSLLLMTVLIVLILRLLFRIFFEEQGYGSLQTKMVVAFICLSILPTLLIFYYSYRQIVRGHDLWFSPQIEAGLEGALELAESSIEMDNRQLAVLGADVLEAFQSQSSNGQEELYQLLESKRALYHLTCIEIYLPDGQRRIMTGNPALPLIYPDWFTRQFGSNAPWVNIVENEKGEFTRLVWPTFPPGPNDSGTASGYLAVGRLTMTPIRAQMEDVRHSLVEYRDALESRKPFRVTQLTGLTVMTMLAIFISVWIGSHLARSLARPLMDLVAGTRLVASGDWDFKISVPGRGGEMTDLVTAFNQMTGELKEMYAELDSRRRFVEIILKNVSTGVVVLETDGKPRDINPAARLILSGGSPLESSGKSSQPVDTENVGVSPIVLPPALNALIEEAETLPASSRRPFKKPLHLTVGENSLSLTVSITPLYSEDKTHLGYLLAFDDLTELERAQRMAAWREVARRIAHEVKNPLTPIQLSAGRLRRRFGDRLTREEDGAIFEECTDVIIRQVEEMKKLVDEFSRFARLPEIKPRPGDFVQFLEESLTLFRQAHKKVDFSLNIIKSPPVFSFDQEQMRRVLTNILDNAVSAMDQEGRVELSLDVDEMSGMRLTIADTGPGMSPEIQERIFDPHFTTKDGGQGLGLAIVRTIVSDHGGFIKTKSRPGNGAMFIIELPIRN